MTRRGQPQPPQRQRPAQPSQYQQEARMFRRDHQQQAGWSMPMPRGYWHYFNAGDVLSLCGKWMYSGSAREDANDERADTCSACASQVRGIRRRQGGQAS